MWSYGIHFNTQKFCFQLNIFYAGDLVEYFYCHVDDNLESLAFDYIVEHL